MLRVEIGGRSLAAVSDVAEAVTVEVAETLGPALSELREAAQDVPSSTARETH